MHFQHSTDSFLPLSLEVHTLLPSCCETRRGHCGELEKPGSATSMQLINAHRSYIDNGRVEAATNAVRENTVPAGHPAFRIRLYDSEKATVAKTEVMLWTAATTENIAPII